MEGRHYSEVFDLEWKKIVFLTISSYKLFYFEQDISRLNSIKKLERVLDFLYREVWTFSQIQKFWNSGIIHIDLCTAYAYACICDSQCNIVVNGIGRPRFSFRHGRQLGDFGPVILLLSTLDWKVEKYLSVLGQQNRKWSITFSPRTVIL